MNRAQAFLVAALVPLMVGGVYAGATRVSASFSSETANLGVSRIAERGPGASETGIVESEGTASAAQAEAVALQSSLAELKQTLTSMDEAHVRQVQDGQARLAAGQQDIEAKQASLAQVKAQVEALQATLGQDAQSVEQQIAVWQAYDTQLRQNLDATMAALDSAYAELAAQPAASATSDIAGGNWVDANFEHEGDEHDEHDDD